MPSAENRVSLSKNVVIAVALLAAGFFAAWVRFRPHLGEEAAFTDGELVYESTAGERIRYAVWDEPRPLGGGVNGPGAEGRAAVSPDGRLLVFAVGERGLNADLWVADLVDGEPVDPRPLAALASEWDECAPAFAPGALLFASDRPGTSGGLDLWRAPYAGGVFGAPERLAGEVNTAADETDPAPLPGTSLVAFASDRRRGLREDFDLYTARRLPGDEAVWRVAPLDELNTPFDEREPSFTADGRSLLLASDRDGGAGGFDLYRSVRERGSWLPPAPLPGLNTAGSERAPAPSQDGFALVFVGERPDPGDGSGAEARDSDLLRARSLELFRRPGRPVGWLDLLILGVLLTLALLAWLAKRWESLEVLYKCFLVSVLVHLLLLWYLQDVFVEGDEVELAGSAPLFQVSLASRAGTESGGADRARDGLLARERGVRLAAAPEPERERDAARRPSADAPSATRRDFAPVPAAEPAPAASLTDAPERAEAAPASGATDAPAPTRTAEARRRSDGAPELALAAAELPAALTRATRGEGRPGAPRRRATEGPSTAGERPALPADLSVPERTAERPAAPAPRRAAAVPASPRGVPSETRAPRQPAAGRRAAPAPTLPALPEPRAATLAERAEREVEAPRRRRAGAHRDPGSAIPSAPAPSERAPVSALVPAGSPERPAPRAADSSPGLSTSRPSATLRAPERADRRVQPAAPAGAVADLAPRTFRRSSGRAAALERPGPRPERARPEPRPAPPKPLVRPLESTLPPPEAAPEVARAEPERRPAPYRSRFGAEKLRALDRHGGSRETEAAVAAGLEYLAAHQRGTGHWGDRRHRDDKYGQVYVGKTGLAVLAFLGAGHTPASGTEHAGVVADAVEHLLGIQDARTGAFGRTSAYGHAIATYALAECFALTEDPALRVPLERAVAWIVRHQDRSGSGPRRGGWGYYAPSGNTFDGWPRASITAWQVMALESARLGGIAVDPDVLARARAFLVGSYDPDFAGFRYSHDPSRLRSGYPTLPGSTPASLFALALLGEDLADPRWRSAVEFVLDRAPRGYRFVSDDHFVFNASGNLYFWYYGSLALLRRGGDAWERWNLALQETLLPAQGPDGSWEPISLYADYAADDGEDRAYTTAMCVLTLEVYYRYFTPLLEER